MKIDGTCHCGAVRWEAEADPAHVYLCHCTDCQAISGGSGRWAVPVDACAFRLLAGTLADHPKTGDSGRVSHQMFCGTCASPVYGRSEGLDPPRVNVRLGTCHQRDRLPPRRELFTESAQPWARLRDPG